MVPGRAPIGPRAGTLRLGWRARPLQRCQNWFILYSSGCWGTVVNQAHKAPGSCGKGQMIDNKKLKQDKGTDMVGQGWQEELLFGVGRVKGTLLWGTGEEPSWLRKPVQEP